MSQLSISADAHARPNMLDQMHCRRAFSASTPLTTVDMQLDEPFLDLAGAMMRDGSTAVADWFDVDEGF